MKVIPLTKGKFALVDDEDFERANQYKWYASKAPSNKFYATMDCVILPKDYIGLLTPTIKSIKYNYKYNRIFLHHFIFNKSGNNLYELDHIDGNSLNNQKSNLRFATHRQNMQNKNIYKNNKSGFKGVYVDRPRKTFIAQITVNGKKIKKRGFVSKEEAAIQYNKWALEYFKEFARLNLTP